MGTEILKHRLTKQLCFLSFCAPLRVDLVQNMDNNFIEFYLPFLCTPALLLWNVFCMQSRKTRWENN